MKSPYTDSLSHTTWECRYHIVFAPKYKRKEVYGNLKYKYGNRVFWCRGYYVSTVGNNKQAVEKHVENQSKEDMVTDQITIKEYRPF